MSSLLAHAQRTGGFSGIVLPIMTRTSDLLRTRLQPFGTVIRPYIVTESLVAATVKNRANPKSQSANYSSDFGSDLFFGDFASSRRYQFPGAGGSPPCRSRMISFALSFFP